MNEHQETTTDPVAAEIDVTALMETFRTMWGELNAIGVGESGVRRFSWTEEDAALRAWFTSQAEARGMDVATDVNGNIRAWWGEPAAGAVATGSHLDSVPDGGLWDGPLGV
ncbi:MAG: allantoate amidohydrolase, partial [Corynebacterium sp.]|nr:allantoate amidohydrolase [Corynebacterium sp.]